MEVGRRIAAEAAAQRPHRLPPVQRLPQRPPGRRIGRDQVRRPTARRRLAVAAMIRTEPRTTVPGQATFRPLARRS